MRRRLLASTVVAVLALGVSGCSDDGDQGSDDQLADHPELLQVSDLPDVESVEVSEKTNVSKTNCPAMDEELSLARSKDFVYAWFQLEGEDTVVRSAVQGPGPTSEEIDPTLNQLSSLIAQCQVTGSVSDGTFASLQDLPDGAVGFVATRDTSNGTQTTERAYAKVDGQRAAVVTVVHVGDGTPSVTVADLLPKAIDRASK